MAEANCIPIEVNVPGDRVPPAAFVRTGWRDTTLADPSANFYRGDELLLDAVADFVAAGLRTVEGSIVVASAAHRQAIARCLEAQGFDLPTAIARQQYISLDAEATLATFTVNGMPDEKLFYRTVGYVVTRMLSAGFRVRVFSEMIALLCARDHVAAAVRLEHLWDDLAKIRRFSLFCAHPMAQLPSRANDAAPAPVDAAHPAVVPAS